jgi:hypothetical protein
MVSLIAHAVGKPVVTPFYYARSIYLSEGEAVRHNFTSATASMIFVEAIFANLPYGTVEGYRREGGRVVPITADRQHDAELFHAMETELPRFARDLAALPLLDRDRVQRELHAFAFDDFTEFCDTPLYIDRVAHLRDAVVLGASEREFAPRLTIREFAEFMAGRDRSTLSRSMPMSKARSRAVPVQLFEWRWKYDWPRWVPQSERDPEDPRRWQRIRHERRRSAMTSAQRLEAAERAAHPVRARLASARGRAGAAWARLRSQ